MSPDDLHGLLHIHVVMRGPDAGTLALRGDIDVATVANLQAALVELIKDGVTAVTLDFGGVLSMDSSGVHTLVVALSDLRQKDPSGTITIANPTDIVRRVFELMHLTDVFGIR
jgi:anti-anti-sigma factor